MIKILAMIFILASQIVLFLVYCLLVVHFLPEDDQNEDISEGGSPDQTV